MNLERNEYAAAVSPGLYAKAPKEVFAAIVVAFAQRFVDEDEVFAPGVVDEMIRVEWLALHTNGIVVQAPPGSGVSS